jgi:hypothetical protein
MKTPLFSFQTPPSRVGVYNVHTRHGCVHYSHWNGVYWGLTVRTPEDAEKYRGYKSISIGYIQCPYTGWQGFTEEQK